MTSTFSAILSLALCAALATFAVSWVADRNKDRIAANQLEWEMRIVAEVLPASGWDNDPWQDRISAVDEELLGSTQPLPIFRARLNGQITTVVLTAIANDAYVGPVKLLVGVNSDETIVAGPDFVVNNIWFAATRLVAAQACCRQRNGEQPPRRFERRMTFR